MPMATDAWINPNSEKSFCVAVSVPIFLWRFSYMDDGNSVSSTGNCFFENQWLIKVGYPILRHSYYINM